MIRDIKVFVFGDVVAPDGRTLRNGEVGPEAVGGGAVPVLLAPVTQRVDDLSARRSRDSTSGSLRCGEGTAGNRLVDVEVRRQGAAAAERTDNVHTAAAPNRTLHEKCATVT
jgi:hypothetical protein